MKMKTFIAPSVLLIVVSCLLNGCGHAERLGPAPVYSCSPGGLRPPSKLILHPAEGIAGRCLVVFLDSVQDIAGTAQTISSKYGGSIIAFYTAAIHGFALNVDDSKALAISQEPSVCWVEQDTMGHGT
jgi:peptidase inhibitor I9